jgi:hypothetical protein
MCLKQLVLIAGFTALLFLDAAPWTPSRGQTAPPSEHRAPVMRHVRPNIVITPGRLLYRRCVERLELQNRPSGPVLYPLTYCWWVRG